MTPRRFRELLTRHRKLEEYFNNDPAAGLSLLAELTGFVRTGMPFCYLRYGDGTFHCIRQTRNRNSDGVALPAGLGNELLQALRETAEASITDRCIMIGGIWTADVERFLIDFCLRESVPWVSANPFYDGLAGLETLEFIKALRDSTRWKVLVGPERIAPAARYLGAKHIVTPLTEAWEHQAEILPRVLAALRPRTLAIFAAGMVSDTWGWKSYRHWGDWAQVIDIGHTFDACLGFKNRKYMMDDYPDHTLRDTVLREYSPLFDAFR